ncbi:phage tail tape measure protein [Pseudomonas brassicacearum]|uniref:phage tail tape measure protein n=1 Tax=Pseudomonas brassicacearum TaxID=930166 RepID=UPI000F4ABD46|nr:phage tail tape measure protein [Pseudomonas brassicacearum]ROM70289.1 phage tail tape measure protein [Pseudomonas brassicacearum]
MADDRYSLKYAAFNESGLAFGNTSLTSDVSAQRTGTSARDQLSGLDLALEKLGLKLGLLTTAVESLTLRLSAQRAMGAAAKAESANESKGDSGGGIEPPKLLKPAIAMDLAMADLKQAARFTPRQIEEMAEPTQQIAIAPLVAAGGTQAVDLVRIESLAATAGIGSDLPNASDRQFELLRFASDAGVAASAFRLPAMEVAEMMVGWRTSMKLSGAQAFDLADASNHLGKIPGGAKAGDIGAVLQRDGAAATAAGLAPVQAAALTAALLNTGSQQTEASVALNTFTTAMGKGDRASATEQAAWKQLGLEPSAVASGLRDKDTAPGTVMSVLAALSAQPAEKRSTLASTLFSSGDEAVLRMAQKLADVNEAFGQVNDPAQYATSQLGNGGSVRQDALALSNTRQGQLNVLSARAERLSVTTGNALAPVEAISLQALGSLADGMNELAESSPKATAAIVLVAAAIKPLVGMLLKALGDEVGSQAAKRVLGTANVANAEAVGSSALSSGGVMASLRSFTRRIPGMFALSAVPEVVGGAMDGDARKVGAGLGSAGGGWAGASAGATGGATVGAFFGPLGAAIGGAIGAVAGGLAGSWIGGESGAWLGDKLAAPADKLPPPDQAAKDLSNAQTTIAQNTMTANIYINGQDQASASQLANLVVQQLSGQFGLTTVPNSLAMRSDAALTDGGT